LDREGHKGGVLILVRLPIPTEEIRVDTNNQAETIGVDILDNRKVRIYNTYCPPNKNLALEAMNIADQTCLVVGDFNSHS
jgi:hypothetical protein